MTNDQRADSDTGEYCLAATQHVEIYRDMATMKKILFIMILFFHSYGFAAPVKLLFDYTGFEYSLLYEKKGHYQLQRGKKLGIPPYYRTMAYSDNKIYLGDDVDFKTRVYNAMNGKKIGEQDGITLLIDSHKSRFYYGNTGKEPILYKTDLSGHTVSLNIANIDKMFEMDDGDYLFNNNYNGHLYLVDKDIRYKKIIAKKCVFLGVISKRSQILCSVFNRGDSFIAILTKQGALVKKIPLEGRRARFYIDEKELIYATSTSAFYKFPFTFFPEYTTPLLITLDGEEIPITRPDGRIPDIPSYGTRMGFVIPSK